MTVRSISRAAFLAALTGAALAAAGPAHAARNEAAERYVQANAAGALQALANREATSSARRQTFYDLMSRFADMPRIANFVLGRYGAQLRADPALRTEWTRAFQDYAIAVYEDQLERYTGSQLSVTGSVERVAGSDVIVRSEMTPRGAGRPLPVQWRLLKTGQVWKVVDVSLIIEGNEIWLAQQQQRDFLAALDRNRGDIRALIGEVRNMTATMRQRTLARG